MSEPVRAADTASDGTEPDPRRWWALVVLAAAQLMIILDASIVNIALPVGAGGPRHQQRRPAVDGDGLHPGLRRPAAARWPDRRLHRPQAHLHHRSARLRRRLRARWARAQPGAAVRRARPAGCLRGPDGAGRAVHRHRHVHRAEGARQGVRRVRRARRWRRRDRPDRRRRAHRVRLVALVPRRQRADRPDRGRRPRSRSCTRARRTATPATTSPASCWPRPGWSRWSTASPRPPRPKNPDDPSRQRRAGLGRTRAR